MVTGTPMSAVGSVVTAQKSPVEDVTFGSKPGVLALRLTVAFAVGAPFSSTGPVSLRSVNQRPVETVPGFSLTVATEMVLPFLPAFRSPTWSMPCRPGVSSTRAGTSETAVAVRLLVPGGTRNVGAACAGNWKDCGPNGDTNCWVSRSFRRGSTWTLIGAIPVLVTLTCAVTALPLGSLGGVEFGSPTVETLLVLKPMLPLKVWLKAVPGTGFTTRMITRQRPGI